MLSVIAMTLKFVYAAKVTFMRIMGHANSVSPVVLNAPMVVHVLTVSMDMSWLDHIVIHVQKVASNVLIIRLAHSVTMVTTYPMENAGMTVRMLVVFVIMLIPAFARNVLKAMPCCLLENV